MAKRTQRCETLMPDVQANARRWTMASSRDMDCLNGHVRKTGGMDWPRASLQALLQAARPGREQDRLCMQLTPYPPSFSMLGLTK